MLRKFFNWFYEQTPAAFEARFKAQLARLQLCKDFTDAAVVRADALRQDGNGPLADDMLGTAILLGLQVVQEDIDLTDISNESFAEAFPPYVDTAERREAVKTELMAISSSLVPSPRI